VAKKLGIRSAETLRKWIRRAEVDAGQRPGLTTAEHEQIKALKKENAELRRANEILKSASAARPPRGVCLSLQTPTKRIGGDRVNGDVAAAANQSL
jgi:transposase-like protein